LNGFNLTQAEDNVKVALTQQAIPLAKRGPFNNIIDWPTFKIKLIEEFGSIDIFGRDVNQTFNLLPRYESVQEVAEDLSPKIKTLQANLEIMQNFHDKEDLHSVALTQQLVQNIMKSLPPEVRPSFNDQFSKFRKQCPANVRPPATFEFLTQFVEDLEKNYRSNPYLYDLESSLLNIGVNVVRQGTSKPSPQPPRTSVPQHQTPPRPCAMCSIKGFEANHYSLTSTCGTGKLSSPEILKLIADNGLCFTCTQAHYNPGFKCKTTYKSGMSKVCPKGCLERGIPVNRKACMHNNQAPFISVSKVSTNQSVPLVETLNLGGTKIGIQYDTGCQLSLISRSTLSTIPQYMYSLGPSYKMKVLTYSGKARVIHTTEVKLMLFGKTLKLTMIDSEIERDSQGMALYRSNLTQGYMVYGSVPSNIVTWVEPLDPPSNRARKFKRSTWQSRKETGGKPDLPVKNPEKNQRNRNRTRMGKRNSRRKLGGNTGKLGGEAEETSVSSRRNQEENQEARVKNQSNRKGNRREPRSLREKSGGQEEKQKENQTLKPNLNLTPTPTSVISDPTFTPVTLTSPESQNYSNAPVESGNLAPAPSSRPEPAHLTALIRQQEDHNKLLLLFVN